MKKASFLLLPLLIMALNTLGQQKPLLDEPLLIALKDGSVIYPETIKPMALPLQKPYLRVDSQYKLPSNEIKYYKDGTSFFYWAEVNEAGEGDLLKVNNKGKVTTYFRNKVSNATADPYGGRAPAAKPDYFQVSNGPIRKISYKNLAPALSGNQASRQKLQEVNRLNMTNKICLVAGGSMWIAGIVHMHKINNNNEAPFIETGLDTKISPLILLGALTLTVPLINKAPVERKLEEAIAIYNK